MRMNSPSLRSILETGGLQLQQSWVGMGKEDCTQLAARRRAVTLAVMAFGGEGGLHTALDSNLRSSKTVFVATLTLPASSINMHVMCHMMWTRLSLVVYIYIHNGIHVHKHLLETLGAMQLMQL